MIPGQLTIYDMTDEKGLEIAEFAAALSLDPSTRTGCAIRTSSGEWFTGMNHFPRGIRRTEDRDTHRPTRLALTIHAELSALLDLYEDGGNPFGATAFITPWPPCADCAGVLIQAGIARVVAVKPTPEQRGRWGASFDLMEMMFKEAGVELTLVETKEA